MKVFHNYFNRSTVFPLSAVCFENIIVQAPNDVHEFLRTIYGPDYMTLPPNTTFVSGGSNPCLATAVSKGSPWSLDWRRDGRARGNARDGVTPVLTPRDDPIGSHLDDYRYPYA